MRDLLRLICVLVALAAPAAAQTPTADAPSPQTPFAPVAVVNGSPITGFDLQQRVRLLQVVAGAEGAPADLQRAALEQLVEDRLKLQAALQRGFEPTEEMLAAGLESFARARGTSVEALQNRLQRAGITELALRDLITAEVAWLQLVRSRFLPDSGPSAADLNAELGQGAAGEADALAGLAPEAQAEQRQQMLGERMGRLAEGLLQDLRRDALIEIR